MDVRELGQLHPHPGRQETQAEIQRLEAAASVQWVFAPALVVGLAQTAAYAEAVFRMGRKLGAPDEPLADVVAARLARQAVLDDAGKTFHFVMGEAALRRALVRPEAMRIQVERIIELVERENISIGVIPFAANEVAHHYHGFAVLGDPEVDDESRAVVPTLTKRLTIWDPAEIAEYVAHFEALRSAALEGAELLRILRGVVAELSE